MNRQWNGSKILEQCAMPDAVSTPVLWSGAMERFTELDRTPAYGVSEAAGYLHLRPAKVRRWAEALCTRGDQTSFPISFVNLLELHVLKAMRIRHQVPMQRIRRAVEVLRRETALEFPLLNQEFVTDGLDLLVREEDSIINLSRFGQRGLREIVETYVQRIELGPKFAKLYPFVRGDYALDPRSVVITPHIGFGRPTIAGTGISTEVIAGRFVSGDSLPDLAAEYRLPASVLEDAIRWELSQKDAA